MTENVARTASSDADQDVRTFGMWIHGEEYLPGHDNRLDSVDPTTGSVWARLFVASEADIDAAVHSAQAAFDGPWSTSASLRATTLLRLADLLEQHAAKIAEYDVRDNGKIIREATTQISSMHRWYRYFAGLTDKVHGRTVPTESASAFNYTVRTPLGVIACITAWNSPILIATVKLAPALAAGNTVVLKPSEFASTSTLEFARLCTEAGMPPGVVNVVTGAGESGARLVSHSGVSRVSFTGSPVTGRRVAELAGAGLKGVSLELGGKSANIVFADADLEAACVGVLGGIFAAAGQSCVAGSRVLVQRAVYDDFTARLAGRTSQIVLGDPLDPGTEMGPIANQPQFDKVQEYVRVAREEGARLVAGGHRVGDGFLHEPTIFADVDNTSRLAQEEVFGPVMALIPFDTEEEASKLANGSHYGLAAGVWTSNLATANRMVRRLHAGTVFVNTYRAMSPSMPFGGVKDSGVGRENGVDAVLDFTEVKSVWIETAPSPVDPFKMRF